MRRFGAAILMLLLLAACHRPVMEETFVKVSDRDVLGRYGFRIDLADTLLTYDLDLLVGMACPDPGYAAFRQMPLHLQWTAPSGQAFEETVWVRRKQLTDSTYYDKYFWVAYRHGLRPVEAGEWGLQLSIPENLTEGFNITGTGVRLTRHGTR